MGIGERENPAQAPAEKGQKLADVFPWSSAWPPPAGAGNYAGEELRALVGSDDPLSKGIKGVIEGYTDAFREHSPVGSFPANGLGLYDLDGNVEEMREDWLDGAKRFRVRRGASWMSSDRDHLRSARRGATAPTTTGRYIGFRVVLAPVAVGQNASAAPAGEKWVDALADWRKGKLPAGIVADGNTFRTTKEFGEPIWSKQLSPDQAIRSTVRLSPEVHSFYLTVRDQSRDFIQPRSNYTLKMNLAEKRITLRSGDWRGRELKTWRLPPAFVNRSVHTIELRAVGDELTVRLNDKLLGSVRDDSFRTGSVQFHAFSDVVIENVEYLDLGGSASPATGATPAPAEPPAPPSANKSTATQDAPFVNSLGMKFVPVPITGGPTGGQRVLFSVWETRVQDYEVFATETQREWPKRGFELEGPTHPTVNVSWEDATAFCAWLTARERAAGRLGAGEVYRLPSDHEWSCAVEIGEREDAAKLPCEKDQKIADVFPWGAAWPPPENSGNYWSEELRALIAAGKHSYLKGELPGYRDGFAKTAPAGSYPANRFGLHDLGGNVWEWCEDWYDDRKENRIVRGASWSANDPGHLLAAKRYRNLPATRHPNFGFRCVPEPAPSPAPAGR